MFPIAGADCRRLEARVRRDHVVRENSPVAPAANAESLRVGDANAHRIVRGRENIRHIDLAPVSEQHFLELVAAARAAARIRRDDHVAVRCQQLPLEVEFVLMLGQGPPCSAGSWACDRVAPPVGASISPRIVSSVCALELDGARPRHCDFLHPGIVVMRELAQAATLHGVESRRLLGRVANHGHATRAASARRRDRTPDDSIRAA